MTPKHVEKRIEKLMNWFEEKESLKWYEEKEFDRIEKREEKLVNDTIEKLHKMGLCGEDGISKEDVDNPWFDGIDHLWHFGDGTWC